MRMKRGKFFSIKTSRKHTAIVLSFFLLSQSFMTNSFFAQTTLKKQSAGASGKLANARRIAHVLNRLSFGVTAADIERVEQIGIDNYIERQLNPETIGDTFVDKKTALLPTIAMSIPTLLEQYRPKPAPKPTPTPTAANTNATTQNQMPEMAMKPDAKEVASQNPVPQKSPQPSPTPAPKNPQQGIIDLQRATFYRAVYSERQLYEMMIGFWNNHFSIFSQKDADRYFLPSFDRDVIRPFAFGRFRDLLGATAHSPAMLFYLDNHVSSVLKEYPAKDGKPARRVGGLNENYARELMELHTLGVDGGYTQKDVEEVARCFTGWTIRKPNEEGLFFFNPAAHDNGEKTVLGHKIPSGGGIRDGEMVLDILARHPSTAKYISTKLARKFISDNPPATVINRAAAIFLKTDGDIRATLRSIITSPEFLSTASYRAKVRSPFEYAVATIRALGAETDADPQIISWVARMGQPMFGRITPDGYADRADVWLSAGQMLSRFNYANAVAANRIKGTKLDTSKLFIGTDTNNLSDVKAKLSVLILSGDMSAQTQAALEKAVNSFAASAQTENQMQTVAFQSSNLQKERADKIAELITLLIGSPEFQRR